jgi:hypothetical protein
MSRGLLLALFIRLARMYGLSADIHGPDSRIRAPLCRWRVDGLLGGQIAKPHGERVAATDRFSWLLCVLTTSLLRQSAAYVSSAQCFRSVQECFLTLLADGQSSLSMADSASCSALSVVRRFERAVCSTNPRRDSRKTYLVRHYGGLCV